MNTTELKKLADDLTFHGRYGHEAEDQASMRRVKRNAEAAAAILKLLAINAEMVEMVKEAAVLAYFAECWITDPAIEGMSRLKGSGDKFRAALAKAEGGEL